MDANSYRDAIRFEGSEAWNHYRHIETQRNNFLSYYLTLSVAATGLLATIATRNDVAAARQAFATAAVLGSILAGIGVMTFWSLERFRFILAHYRRVLVASREMAFEGSDDATRGFYRLLEVRDTVPEAFSGRFLGPQAMAETVTLCLVVAWVTLPVAGVVTLPLLRYTSTQEAFVSGGAVCDAFIAALAVWQKIRSHPSKRQFIRNRGRL